MILLDTNVISELMRPHPDEDVLAWFGLQSAESLFTTTITFAEVLYGVAILPKGQRKNAISAAVGDMFANDFCGRVLPFDMAAAVSFADICAARRVRGRPISQSDAQIAAIALTRNARVATRNVKDFDECGVALMNPWVTA